MSVDVIINLLATIALFVMMMTVGLSVSIRDLLRVARNWRLSLRAGAANYLLVPAIAIGLLLLFRPLPMVAVGFLVAVVCPGAPFGPSFTAIAKGNIVAAVGLMAVLAGSSAIIAPLLLRVLLPIIADQRDLTINSLKILTTLMLSQFLPLCLGLSLRRFRPATAERLKDLFGKLSALLSIILIGVIIAVQFQMLRQIRIRGYFGMLLMVIATVAAGWLAGGIGSDQRKTMAITTSTRNVGVALVIAASSFPGTPAITAATAYALFQTLAVFLISLAWGRMSPNVPLVTKAAA